ncbi:MAG: cobalt ECF transporter T component CbiQ [Methanobrevibacter sp.]|jgi:cobalt/nickel transport system permease protein|nr:cobalt ECF transporter T component CbiQ [Candidatus Methanovirga meridionalis]
MVLRIDEVAHDNKLKDFNPKLKVLLSFILLIIALIANSSIISFLILILNIVLTVLIAKIPLKFYLKFISIPLVFTIFTSIFLILFSGSGAIIYNINFFTIREDSLNLGINTFFRVLASFSALGFLSMTTPINEIFHILYKLRIPKIFLEIAMLMYNTIFMFLEQIEIMKNAQKTRLGYHGLKNSYRSTGLLLSSLFFKSLERSEKLQNSLDSRCFNGDFPIYES